MGWKRLHLALRKRYLAAAALVLLVLFALPYKRHFLRRRLPLRAIVYSCDHHDDVCGGWADRQKGIVTAYVVAAMLGTGFRIHMTTPCDVAFFLAPRAGLDWRLAPRELDGRDVQWIKKLDGRANKFIKDLLSREDPRDMFDAEYVFLTTNMDVVHLLRQHRLAQNIPWLQEPSVPKIYKHVLTELFDMMAGPRAVLEGFKQSLPPATRLVCAQIRVGGGSDVLSFNTVEQLEALVTFLTPYNSSSNRVLFTSDSPAMTRLAQARFAAVTLHFQGPVQHVDRASGNDVCGGLGRAIVEQAALSLCDVLVISESGLGRIAAFLRDTDRDLFIFHDGRVETFRRADPFPNRLW
ncbi:uncharacterized protein [Littorina saxatilis]